MAHINRFVSFLRQYGPIATSDNMYDELIRTELQRFKIDPPIHIEPYRYGEVEENFKSSNPKHVILTGTAGDGKTFQCRNLWDELDGTLETWDTNPSGIFHTELPSNKKTLTIVKDMSELSLPMKNKVLKDFTKQLELGENYEKVYLIAANDGQLLNSWTNFVEKKKGDRLETLQKQRDIVENLVIEGESEHDSLHLKVINLSHQDPSSCLKNLIKEIAEHEAWKDCEGCPALEGTNQHRCPIRVNLDRLHFDDSAAIFQRRLGELLRLARANKIHYPIRDLLMLISNILLGKATETRGNEDSVLMNCESVQRKATHQYPLSNPYANAFGANLDERSRETLHAFETLDSFGVGRETRNRYDNLILYGAGGDPEVEKTLLDNDQCFGLNAFKDRIDNYLEDRTEGTKHVFEILERQRRRLFFTIDHDNELVKRRRLNPWDLTVFRHAGEYIEFLDALGDETKNLKVSTTHKLCRGLNRTFTGLMHDDDRKIYLSMNDVGAQMGSVLVHELQILSSRNNLHPFITFSANSDKTVPTLEILQTQALGEHETRCLAAMELLLPKFEFLMRVAAGALPISFSRQCYEEFQDFRKRLLSELSTDSNNVDQPIQLLFVDVNPNGRSSEKTVYLGDVQ